MQIIAVSVIPQRNPFICNTRSQNAELRVIMAGKIDLVRLKTQVEVAMEVLLRAADARVSWIQSPHHHPTQQTETTAAFSRSLPYAFLPGVYRSIPSGSQEKSDAESAGSAAPQVARSATTEARSRRKSRS